MAKKIIYHYGDTVGDKGCTFIKELPSTRDNQGKSVRQGEFTCAICGEPFSANIKMVRMNHRFKCDNCTNKPKEYKYGDILSNNPKIIYLESAGSNKFQKRLAKVQNCETGEIFTTILSGVINGHTKYGPESCKTKRIEHSSQARRQYHPGDTLQNIYGEKFLYIKEIEYPYCQFKNLQENIIFETTIYNVLYGTSDGCPISRGETVIAMMLNKLNLVYQTQKTFPDLKSDEGKSLRYDFWIPSYNCLLEYDGGQHFFAVPKWGGEEYLAAVQRRDKIKNDYAEDKGYNLIRISYTDLKCISVGYIQSLLNNLQQKGEE